MVLCLWYNGFTVTNQIGAPSMRPGKLATIRVNPQDCMSIVDVLDKLGVSTVNLSFSQATKIVLASALEAFRQNNTIPTRSGFEYTEMMQPFATEGYQARGKQLANAKLQSQESFHPPVIEVTPDTAETRARKVRFDELMFCRQADPTNFTDADLSELAPLLEEFQR